MIQFAKNKEPGRNDDCPCGSGKKYKKCCLIAKKQFGAEELLKCFYLLMKFISEGDIEFKKGGLTFMREQIDNLPKNWKQDVVIALNEKAVKLSLKSQSKIILPEKRIIT